VIGELIGRAARRSDAADLVAKSDETLSLAFESGRLKSAGYLTERGINLRVVVEGKMGFAGSTGDDPEALLELALASARVGEAVTLSLPEPAPLPRVLTHFPRAASATLSELSLLGQTVHDRLAHDGCLVNVLIERSVGSVQVANTRGVDASYDVSSVSVSAEVVRVRPDEVLTVSDFLAGADLPSAVALERMIAGILQRLAWAARSAPVPHGSHPVCFTPAGAQVLLLPLQAALQGKAVVHGVSPLGGRRGAPTFTASLTITDEPLLDGRTGSRPVDDEGVPSRSTPLIVDGQVCGLIYDLESAGRAGVQPTGHGRRTTFGKAQSAFTNLSVSPGELALPDAIGLIENGLLVDDLRGVGQGNVIGGTFAHPVGVAYRVEAGEVVGRVAEATVAGNAYELLGRIAGLGREAHWRGSAAVPAIVVEGVTIS
jgi:PmbA protein